MLLWERGSFPWGPRIRLVCAECGIGVRLQGAIWNWVREETVARKCEWISRPRPPTPSGVRAVQEHSLDFTLPTRTMTFCHSHPQIYGGNLLLIIKILVGAILVSIYKCVRVSVTTVHNWSGRELLVHGLYLFDGFTVLLLVDTYFSRIMTPYFSHHRINIISKLSL